MRNSCTIDAQSSDVNYSPLSHEIFKGALSRAIQCVTNAWIHAEVVVSDSSMATGKWVKHRKREIFAKSLNFPQEKNFAFLFPCFA